MAANRCGSCDYLNNRDTKWGGEQAWCNYKGYYVKKDSGACNEYTYHGHRYGRFLVTAVEEILSKQLEYQDSFDEFMNNAVSDNNIDLYEMYSFYDDYLTYGSLLKKHLADDKNKEYIANYILEHGIIPTIEKSNNGEYENAFNIYSNTFYKMLNFYNINSTDEQSKFQRIKK